MGIEVIKLGDIIVLRPGKSLTVFDFEDLVNPIPELPKEAVGIVLDLLDTVEIDSFGVATIIRIMSYAKSNNQKFSIAVSNNKVLFILKIDKLDTVLPLYNSVEEAISHIRG
ncbi:MAG: STAS domain-containing protein [Brevinematia bacterium]